MKRGTNWTAVAVALVGLAGVVYQTERGAAIQSRLESRVQADSVRIGYLAQSRADAQSRPAHGPQTANGAVGEAGRVILALAEADSAVKAAQLPPKTAGLRALVRRGR